jgi:hypothetical protein
VYGPRISVFAGSYAIDFYLKLDAPAWGAVADLDVVSGDTRRWHAGRRLAGAAFTADRRCQPFTLLIELEAKTDDLEFRTRSHGSAFSLCKVVVRKP